MATPVPPDTDLKTVKGFPGTGVVNGETAYILTAERAIASPYGIMEKSSAKHVVAEALSVTSNPTSTSAVKVLILNSMGLHPGLRPLLT